MENWKIIDRARDYEVNDEGIIRKRSNGRLIRQHIIRGHPMVKLTIEGKQTNVYVHTLVAEAFVPGKRPDWIVVHKDDDRFNLHAKNLRWRPRYNRVWEFDPVTRTTREI